MVNTLKNIPNYDIADKFFSNVRSTERQGSGSTALREVDTDNDHEARSN